MVKTRHRSIFSNVFDLPILPLNTPSWQAKLVRVRIVLKRTNLSTHLRLGGALVKLHEQIMDSYSFYVTWRLLGVRRRKPFLFGLTHKTTSYQCTKYSRFMLELEYFHMLGLEPRPFGLLYRSCKISVAFNEKRNLVEIRQAFNRNYMPMWLSW